MIYNDEPYQECFVCGRTCLCARHHLIGGPYRKKADILQLYKPICVDCHAKLHDRDHALKLELEQEAQRIMTQERGWTLEKWVQEFGRNYKEK